MLELEIGRVIGLMMAEHLAPAPFNKIAMRRAIAEIAEIVWGAEKKGRAERGK